MMFIQFGCIYEGYVFISLSQTRTVGLSLHKMCRIIAIYFRQQVVKFRWQHGIQNVFWIVFQAHRIRVGGGRWPAPLLFRQWLFSYAKYVIFSSSSEWEECKLESYKLNLCSKGWVLQPPPPSPSPSII